jgi:hypothetical protein
MRLSTVIVGLMGCLACSDGGSDGEPAGTGGVEASSQGGFSASEGGSGGRGLARGGASFGNGGSSTSGGSFATASGGSDSIKGGSPSGGRDGGVGGTVSAAGGAMGSVGEQCHDLVGARVRPEFEVLSGSAPAPEGGGGLAGTYDLYRTQVYVRAGLAADDSEACEAYADQGGIGFEVFTSLRMVENGDSIYAVEVLLDFPEIEATGQTTSVVEVDSSGTKLDLVVGSSQCIYTSDDTGEEIERSSAMPDADYESIGFTVTGDVLVLIMTRARSIDAPGPPDCQTVDYYRRR